MSTERIFSSKSAFYQAFPHLDGYGSNAHDFSPIPLGSDERHLYDRAGLRWMITLAAAAGTFRYPETYRTQPDHARGAVIAVHTPPLHIWVLTADIDLHTALQVIWQHPSPTVEELTSALTPKGADHV